MGETKDTETATYEVLSRYRRDGERYVPGDTVELTAKQHAQAFASGAVSEEPVDPDDFVDPSDEDSDGEGGASEGPKPPARKKAASKKTTTKTTTPPKPES